MLAEISAVIGDSATMRLVMALGGREIRIPMRHSGKTWEAIVSAIGEDAAVELCRVFAGEMVYIASSQRMHTEYNRIKAARMRAQGMSWREIAASLTRPQGYTERGARKLLDKKPSAIMQADLFAENVPVD